MFKKRKESYLQKKGRYFQLTRKPVLWFFLHSVISIIWFQTSYTAAMISSKLLTHKILTCPYSMYIETVFCLHVIVPTLHISHEEIAS